MAHFEITDLTPAFGSEVVGFEPVELTRRPVPSSAGPSTSGDSWSSAVSTSTVPTKPPWWTL